MALSGLISFLILYVAFKPYEPYKITHIYIYKYIRHIIYSKALNVLVSFYTAKPRGKLSYGLIRLIRPYCESF